MNRKIVAIVGMCGAGKSEVSRFFEELGLKRIRFGDVTDEYLKKKNLPRTEKNERYIREYLRKKYGMSAYAKLNVKKIKRALEKSDVILDGLYSWEEYLYLKKIFGKTLIVTSVHASPQTRYERLIKRRERPLSLKESISRDISEVENINKAGPIAMADFVILNQDKTLEQLREEVVQLWKKMKRL